MIQLQPGATPLYQQIYRAIREEIRTGALNAGARLPSRRKLAEELGVSVTTVDTAYAQLADEGFICSQPQRGYYVLAIEQLMSFAPPVFSPIQEHVAAARPLIDFSPAGVDAEKFPFSLWRKLLRQSFDGQSAELLSSPDAQGLLTLREEVARYVYEARSVRARPEEIVIGAGTENLLQILGFILGSNTCTIAMENPVYNRAYQVFEHMGFHVQPVEIDSHGIRVDTLEQSENIAVYTTPSHQFPLGVSMPISRRIKLLNWTAKGHARYVIEDDYDSEFRYAGRPLPSLQSIDQAGRVVYLGTFTRSVAPCLRISYMVLPKILMPLYSARARFASSVSRLEQAALARFMAGGYFERHVNRMRVAYRQKRALLEHTLRAVGLHTEGENAGHHLIVRTRLDAEALCARALKVGVKVYPLRPYFIGEIPERYKDCVLLGYGGLSKAQIEQGVMLLCQALD